MGLRSLRELDLERCDIKQLPERGLTSLTSLTSLNLHKCACLLRLCSVSESLPA